MRLAVAHSAVAVFVVAIEALRQFGFRVLAEAMR
jgi:hypothetical protein